LIAKEAGKRQVARVAPKQLDRKARLAVTAALFVLLAGPLLLARSCVSTLAFDEPIIASGNGDDRLVLVGGHTMLLDHGSPGRRIADWLHLEGEDARTFEIGDQIFAPHSLEFTPAGSSQLAHFSQLMKGHGSLRAGIFVSGQSTNADVVRLEKMRATRLRAEIVSRGVSPTRITTSENATERLVRADEAPHLVVHLSRGA